ncbi:hypothetical protein ACI2OX_21695 [Bacillus sp. N9]
MLRALLEDFNKLTLKPSVVGNEDVIGDAYQFMIERFASDAGKKAENFTRQQWLRNYLLDL